MAGSGVVASAWRLTLVGSARAVRRWWCRLRTWRWAQSLRSAGRRLRQPARQPARDRARLRARRLRLHHAAAGRADHSRRRPGAGAARQRSGRDHRHLCRQSAELAVHLGVDLRHGPADRRARRRASIPPAVQRNVMLLWHALLDPSPQLLDATAALFWPLLWPMLAGSVPIGLLTAAIVYYISRNVVRGWRLRIMNRTSAPAE